MDTAEYIKTGQSVINSFFEYYEKTGLDDEKEFFPVLKIIILGIRDCLEDDEAKAAVENDLREYSKKLYSTLWVMNVNEDDEIDINQEQKEANITFEELYAQT